MIKIDFWQVQQYLCLEKVRTIFKLLPKCVWLIKEAFLKLKNITLNFRKISIHIIFFHKILIDGCGKSEKWENEIILNEKNSEPDLLMTTELKTELKDVGDVYCCHFQIVWQQPTSIWFWVRMEVLQDCEHFRRLTDSNCTVLITCWGWRLSLKI